MIKTNYENFLVSKSQLSSKHGFKPTLIPEYLFSFQKKLLEWALEKGRGAIFADCGLGKTPIALSWAEQIVKRTNKNILILTPLAVGHQFVKEASKFEVTDVSRSFNGKVNSKITIANYEKLQLFNHSDFVGVVCDESSILKNFDGSRRLMVTEFLKKMPYRLLCTATAAPNDYIELGTSSEALGVMGFMDVLSMFFKNDQSNGQTRGNWMAHGGSPPKWRFKKHAEDPFWRWVCSWSRALRKPSDLGFDDNGFVLPGLVEKETVIKCSRPLPGKLFVEPALCLKEQREDRPRRLSGTMPLL